ncbi:MAG: BACON domain-containing protein, partial [Bacteroidales bacterium]|nr:BACON domain-containing protein [Bacteroidales bacterium]
MKNRFLFRPILCALLGLLALTACRPELDYVVDSFRSSQATLSGGGETITVLFNSEAGTASIDLSASGSWTAEFVNGRAYWCTLSQTEGKRGLATLTFSVQANGEYDERSASVVFTSGDLKRTVVVVQKQRDAMLVSSGRFDIDAEGGTLTIEVSSNVDFTHAVAADAGDWIHSMSTKGLRQTGVVFRIDANPMLT